MTQREKTTQTVQKHFYQLGSFKDKKGNYSKLPKMIFLKFCDIVREHKCQIFMWSVNFSCARKSIKSFSEDGGNIINKNLCPKNIVILSFLLIFKVLITSLLIFHFPYVILQILSILKYISQTLLK